MEAEQNGDPQTFEAVAVDGDGQVVEISIVSQPVDEFGNQLGSLSVVDGPSGRVIQHNPGDACDPAEEHDIFGTFTATFLVTDDDCDDSNVATLTLTVLNTPDGPLASPDTFDDLPQIGDYRN